MPVLDGSMGSDEKYQPLHDVVFSGLENRNSGFDSPLICHVSPIDFGKVIDRCANLNVEIIGIEVFSSKAELLEIEISPEPGLDWARRMVGKYQERSGVTFCASVDAHHT
jgi:hypothetical protein